MLAKFFRQLFRKPTQPASSVFSSQQADEFMGVFSKITLPVVEHKDQIYYQISFSNTDWGFNDDTLDPFLEAIKNLKVDFIRLFHNRVVMGFHDKSEAYLTVSILRSLKSRDEFRSFHIGYFEAEKDHHDYDIRDLIISEEKDGSQIP